ncbi:MAG: hypothetical protein R6W86_04125 [Marinobacter sp.]|uniref:hypothetical protein n=1 Tax=Marinobacter sp. TaxID=50741 RepID=UPI00396E69C0
MHDSSSALHQIGQLMCEATREILWQPAAGRLSTQATGGVLRCRLGSGQATYHRYDPRRKLHLINYGLRMIAAKQRAETADGWLSTRELRGRSYFGGELSTLNLLAHTCCHEFAHLLQYSAGQRAYGSVHNRHFYEILDHLHDSGAAMATRDFLLRCSTSKGIRIPDAPFELPDRASIASQWQVGEPVAFGEGAHRREGQIVRVNRKTCTVQGTGDCRGSRYRVPLSMLRKSR